MTRQEIITALVSGSWTREDLDAFYDAMKDVRGRVNAVAKWQFAPGDRVKFTGRRGRVCIGTVEKLMTKNVLVNVDDGLRWRVSPSILKKID